MARSINKSLEEERRNRQRKNSGLPFAPGLIQVRSKLMKHEINAIYPILSMDHSYRVTNLNSNNFLLT